MFNRVGYVYEVVAASGNDIDYENGDIVVMSEDDYSTCSCYDIVKTNCKGSSNRVMCDRELKQLWPIPASPVETITLLGKTYPKTAIEQALSNIKEV